MMYNTYDVGDLVHITVDITVSGSYIDPSYLELRIRPPSGLPLRYVYGTDPEIKKTATGRFYIDYYVPDYGQYYYRWYMSGTVWGVEEEMFFVRKPNL